MVVVFTARLSPQDFLLPLDMLASYIIPAVKSQASLPENTNGEQMLLTRSALWQNTDPADRQKINKK